MIILVHDAYMDARCVWCELKVVNWNVTPRTYILSQQLQWN